MEQEHRSLTKPFEQPPTQPLVDPKELEEMAKTALKKQVDIEIQTIMESDPEFVLMQATQQQILRNQEKLIELFNKNSSESQKYKRFRLEVLQKLKAKLETV